MPDQGNSDGGGLSVGGPLSGMLVVEAQLEGCTWWALVDTGCSVTLVSVTAVTRCCMRGWRTCLKVMDGSKIWTLGSIQIKSLMVCRVELGPWEVQVMQWLPLGVDIVIGLDTIMDNGLLVLVRQGQVQVEFHGGVVAVTKAEPCDVRASKQKAASSQGSRQTLIVANDNFEAKFEEGHWMARRWRWKEGTSSVSCSHPNYTVPRVDQAAMEEEVQAWITAGVLVPWNEEEHRVVHNIVPLMSISQQKGEMSKVQPVLDFCKLNKNVTCLTGGMPTCEEKLKEWRKFGC